MVWPDSSSVLTRNDGIFLGQATEGDAHLFLVGLGLRLDRLRDHRLREDHLLERDDRARIAQRLARGHVAQADAGGDVAGQDLLDLFALVGVHLQDPADALLLAADRVVDRVARLQNTGIDAHERQLADVRVGHQLEGQGRELCLVGALAHRRPVVVVGAGNRRDVGRRRHEIDDGIEHALHALVLERAAAEHGMDLARDRARADAGDDLGFRELARFEVLVHHLFVGLGRGLDHLLAPLLGLGLELWRNFGVVELHALRRVVPVDRLHLDEIDDALEVLLGTDRNDDHDRVRLQTVDHHLADAEEIGARAVHLVDERETRHLVLVGLAPDGLGLRLHAAHRVVHHDRAVQHAHRALDLDREVDVARGVDDVDAVLGVVELHALPEARGRGRGDRDAALLLLLHPVHRRGAVVHLADLVVDARVEQDALGRRRLAGVDVGRDTDVPIALDGGLAGHVQLLCGDSGMESACGRRRGAESAAGGRRLRRGAEPYLSTVSTAIARSGRAAALCAPS